MRIPVFTLIVFLLMGSVEADRRVEPPEFVFARLIYSSHFGGRGFWSSRWATDYPKADRQFIFGVQRLTNLRIRAEERAIQAMDPDLFKYPFLYAVEVGAMNLSAPEAERLREYLLRGGFLVVDDFWGTYQWQNFYRQIRKVFPDREIEEIPLSHPIFHCFYDIDRIIQIPNVGNATSGRGITHEQDGYIPYCLGIFDDQRRLMVVINWNTDLGDAWEWADLPQYPNTYSGTAYRMGINFIIYAMTH